MYFQLCSLASPQTLPGARVGWGVKIRVQMRPLLLHRLQTEELCIHLFYVWTNVSTVKIDFSTTDLEDWRLCALRASSAGVIPHCQALDEFWMKESSRLSSPARPWSEPFPDEVTGNRLWYSTRQIGLKLSYENYKASLLCSKGQAPSLHRGRKESPWAGSAQAPKFFGADYNPPGSHWARLHAPASEGRSESRLENVYCGHCHAATLVPCKPQQSTQHTSNI